MSGERPEAFGVFYGRFEGEVLPFFVRATRRADVASWLLLAALKAARL